MTTHIKPAWILWGLLGLGAFIAFVLSLYIGPVSLSPWQAALDGLQGSDSIEAMVIWEIRLPRSLLALLVGASLGMSGAVMQGLLRNPLAEPGIMGVTNGAALGSVMILYFGLTGFFWALPLAAISGALLALLAVYWLAGISASVLTLVLAGVAISSLAGALISVALNFAPNLFAMQEIVFWLMGSLANRTSDHVLLAAPCLLLGWALMLSRYRLLDALSLGEDTARTLGFAVNRDRAILLLGVSLSVGASVAVSGSIGFVGLIVPHLLRPWVQQKPGLLLIASALGGAILLLLADNLVRLMPLYQELKLGVVTSLLGGPFFLYLILKNRSRWV